MQKGIIAHLSPLTLLKETSKSGDKFKFALYAGIFQTLINFPGASSTQHTQLSSVKSNGGGGKRAKPGDMSRRRSITPYVCKREAAVFSLASFSHARASLIRRGCLLFFFSSREKENRCLVLDSCLVLLEDQVPFVFTAFIVLWTKECNVFFLKAEESEGN
jgi:hypothetical protein